MRNLRSMALGALWHDCLEVVAFNVVLGGYNVLKSVDERRVWHAPAGRSLAVRLRSLAEEWVHPDDLPRCLALLDRMAGEEAARRRRRASALLRWRLGPGWARAVMEILHPADFSLENPWALLCVRRAGDADSAEDAALAPFSSDFRRILKICLEDGRCEIVRMADEDLRILPADSACLTDWFEAFAAAGGIHPDDLAACRAFVDLDGLRRLAASGARRPGCRYRRLSDGEYRRTLMEILPCPDAGDGPHVMLYVRDVEDVCARDERRFRMLEDALRRDPTGLKNRRAYEVEREALHRDAMLRSLGLVIAIPPGGDPAAADGRAAALADILAAIFRRDSCFRLGPGSFAVLLPNIPEDVMGRRLAACRARLEEDGLAATALGHAWGAAPVSPEALEELAAAVVRA